jgi:DNA-directed RNA polymerase beta subunit
LTDEAGIFGHTHLYDGGTGERFHQAATVGVIYMLKLDIWLMIRCTHVQSTILTLQQPLVVKRNLEDNVLRDGGLGT